MPSFNMHTVSMIYTCCHYTPTIIIGGRSRTMSKGPSSCRQLSLLELSQPESWDQLNRDIKQRMQYTHPQHTPSVRNTASSVNSRQRPQDISEVNVSACSEGVNDMIHALCVDFLHSSHYSQSQWGIHWVNLHGPEHMNKWSRYIY